jgi:hypothetical protein
MAGNAKQYYIGNVLVMKMAACLVNRKYPQILSLLAHEPL